MAGSTFKSIMWDFSSNLIPILGRVIWCLTVTILDCLCISYFCCLKTHYYIFHSFYFSSFINSILSMIENYNHHILILCLSDFLFLTLITLMTMFLVNYSYNPNNAQWFHSYYILLWMYDTLSVIQFYRQVL